jgi:hypothetical protein
VAATASAPTTSRRTAVASRWLCDRCERTVSVEDACCSFCGQTRDSEITRLMRELGEQRARAERAEAQIAAVRDVLRSGPRHTDRHLEAAADAVVDEVRAALGDSIDG